MKKRLVALCVCICLLFVFSGTASAKQLSVSKVVQNADIKTGDSVSIALEFENPFNRSIPINIQDNNVLGNNGLEIQCYEYTLPDKQDTKLSYDFQVQAFSAGDFTLDPATVTYTNPDTGNQETVKSEPMKVSIKQGQASGQQQGITRIYNCNGVSMQSTSYSSGGSTSISIGGGPINRQDQQTPIQQTDQDMQNLKEELNRQQQNYQNMQEELRNRIENNSEFTRMKEELGKQGYIQQNKNITPESNDSGTFKYNFTKGNESAGISGKMNAGKMETINKQTSEDIKKIQQYIESNETFKQMQGELSDKGYSPFDKKIDLGSNISSFEYRYNDSQGRNASVVGNVTSAGEVKDISLQEEKAPLPYWLLIFLAVPLVGVYLYWKYRSNITVSPVKSAPEKMRVDPKEEALARLERAVGIFNDGMQKEAYAEASSAVRIYFKGTLGIKEFTSDEILKSVRGSKDEAYIEDVRQCFILCDLVKFARYEPNSEDFNSVIAYAKRIIV